MEARSRSSFGLHQLCPLHTHQVRFIAASGPVPDGSPAASKEAPPRSARNLLHVTTPLSNRGIFVQICWTRCNKTNIFQCCQYPGVIRILPEESNVFTTSRESFRLTDYSGEPARTGQYGANSSLSANSKRDPVLQKPPLQTRTRSVFPVPPTSHAGWLTAVGRRPRKPEAVNAQ